MVAHLPFKLLQPANEQRIAHCDDLRRFPAPQLAEGYLLPLAFLKQNVSACSCLFLFSSFVFLAEIEL
jgi:hypothetical protein